MGRGPGFYRGFFTAVKYSMFNYKLYTLIDITGTRQHRFEQDKDLAWKKNQNFNTVLQTLGLRSNIFYDTPPIITEVAGNLVGFDTDNILRVWRFDWSTEQDLYSLDNDPVGNLKEDFHLVPYINGLDETIEQTYPVFNVIDPGKNIVFFLKQ